LWGLMLKRGAVSGESAGVLQRLQLLLFEIELPVRFLPAPLPHCGSVKEANMQLTSAAVHRFSNATDFAADRSRGLGLPAPSPPLRQPLPDLFRRDFMPRCARWDSPTDKCELSPVRSSSCSNACAQNSVVVCTIRSECGGHVDGVRSKHARLPTKSRVLCRAVAGDVSPQPNLLVISCMDVCMTTIGAPTLNWRAGMYSTSCFSSTRSRRTATGPTRSWTPARCGSCRGCLACWRYT
jgi:hypothetical protein